MADGKSFPTGLSVDEAQARITEVAAKHLLPVESVPLHAALTRILAEDVHAPRNVPGYANSAMDGFALRGSDLPTSGEKVFSLIGEVLAGGKNPQQVTNDTCVRITTGAPMPRGADTVVMKENSRTEGERVWIAAGTASGANVRPMDEDYVAGDLALRRGMRLAPAQIAALASFGATHANVARRPRVVLLTTGDELTAPGEVLDYGHVYDSNRYSIGGLLEQHGAELLRHERLRDDPALLREALRRASADADIIVSSGGVSVGEADFMPSLIAEIGEVIFWKVRMRPGMPFLFGQIANALMFALPGNPVSGIATFLALVRPALDTMSNAYKSNNMLRARLARAIHKRHSRTEFQRAQLECDADGVLRVGSVEHQGSGMLRGVVEANALIVLSESQHEFAVGEVVDVLPLPGWQ